MRMMHRMWVEALKLFRRKQNNSLVAADLCIEVLLLIVVAWSDVTCTPVSMHSHCTILATSHRPSPSIDLAAMISQPLDSSLTDVQNRKANQSFCCGTPS